MLNYLLEIKVIWCWVTAQVFVRCSVKIQACASAQPTSGATLFNITNAADREKSFADFTNNQFAGYNSPATPIVRIVTIIA